MTDICECGNPIIEYTCRNCGLVHDEFRIIVDISGFRNRNETTPKRTWLPPLCPDVEYYHHKPKRCHNEELNRALRIQSHRKTEERDYYRAAYEKLSSLCANLQLSTTVAAECHNIALNCIKKIRSFYGKRYGDYRYLATVKIACDITDTYIDIKELICNSIEYENEEINLRSSKIKHGINKAMVCIKEILNITTSKDMHVYITNACNRLGVPYNKGLEIQEIYKKISDRLPSMYKPEGYILAIIYLKCKTFSLLELQKTFHVSVDTIRRRIKELKGE